MSIQELFEMIAKVGVTPADSKIFLIGASDSIQYLNAMTNMSVEDITKFLYALYNQNPLVKTAIDALREMIVAEQKISQPVVGTPVNTGFVDANASKAVEDAINELGAIYVSSGSKVKC